MGREVGAAEALGMGISPTKVEGEEPRMAFCKGATAAL